MVPRMEQPTQQEPAPATTFTSEFKRWLTLSIPTAIMLMLRMAMGMTDLAFVGHIGTQELAAASLVIVYTSLLSAFLLQGGAKAVNSLCAMAFGAGDPQLVATFGRVGTIATMVSAIPLATSLWWAGPIMQVIAGCDDTVAGMVATFARPFIAIVFIKCAGACLNSFLLAQKVTAPQLVGALVGAVLNVVFNAWFIDHFTGWPFVKSSGSAAPATAPKRGLGLVGSPLATLASSSVVLVVTFAWALLAGKLTVCRASSKSTPLTFVKEKEEDLTTPLVSPLENSSSNYEIERGMARVPVEGVAEAEQQQQQPTVTETRRGGCDTPLAIFAKQAVPMAATAILQECQIQLITVFAARLGVVQLATHNSILEVILVLTTLMWAASAATRVRTAHHLGRGSVRDAKRVVCIGVSVSGVLSVVIGISLYLVRHHIGEIFSDDAAIIDLAAKLTQIMAPTYVCMAAFYSSMAVLTAQGRPGVIAVAFFLGGWGISVPTSYVFAYVWPSRDGAIAHALDVLPDKTRPHGMGLIGLWIGLALGFVVMGLIGSVAVLTSKWSNIVRHIRENMVHVDGDDPGVEEEVGEGDVSGGDE